MPLAPSFRVEHTNNPDLSEAPPYTEYWTEGDAYGSYESLKETYEFLWLLKWGVRADTGRPGWVCTFWSPNAWPEDPGDLNPNEGWAEKRGRWTARTFFTPTERHV